MPLTFFEGGRADQRDELQRRNLERRFYALAAAVREHEAQRMRSGLSSEDEALYRRLRQLCGERPTAEHEVA
jgi:hypothetical protein